MSPGSTGLAIEPKVNRITSGVGGVIRALTQDLGLDRFVTTGSLVKLDWHAARIIEIHEPGNTE